MAKPVDLQALEQEQQALQVLTGEFRKTRDPDRIKQLSELVAEQSERLQAMAQEFESQENERHGIPSEDGEEGVPRVEPKTAVQLSPIQQQRVAVLTGVSMELLLLDDLSGVQARQMAVTFPWQIEMLAVQAALEQREAAASRKASRETANDVLATMDLDDSPDRQQQIEELRNDPDFLEGLLHEDQT